MSTVEERKARKEAAAQYAGTKLAEVVAALKNTLGLLNDPEEEAVSGPDLVHRLIHPDDVAKRPFTRRAINAICTGWYPNLKITFYSCGGVLDFQGRTVDVDQHKTLLSPGRPTEKLVQEVIRKVWEPSLKAKEAALQRAEEIKQCYERQLDLAIKLGAALGESKEAVLKEVERTHSVSFYGHHFRASMKVDGLSEVTFHLDYAHSLGEKHLEALKLLNAR